MQSGQHQQSQRDQVEEEKVVHFVADPSNGEESQDRANEMEDGLLLLGFTAESIHVLHAPETTHNLVANLLKLLLLHTGPCIGFEDLDDKEGCKR